jgi:hypothetical protein
MADLPSASTRVSATAGALSTGINLCCILAPCAQSADIKPRQFGGADAIFQQHGYNEGLEYAALHVEQTDLPVLFVGMPIQTPGVVSREDTSGNTGSSASTVVAGGSGVLGEHHGILSVVSGGTVGTDQIVLSLSLDDGRNTKTVRLGTNTTYAVPYFGISLNFTVGTLNAGDIIHTWHGSGPLSSAASWTAARTALATQLALFRSTLLIGDLQTHTDAANYLGELNAYATQNERFIFGRASVRDRLPQAQMSKLSVQMTATNLTFLEVGSTGDTVTRAAGSWITDGFAVGDVVTFAGSASNNVTGPIAALTATVLTFGTTDLANEGPVSGVTCIGSPGLTYAEVGSTGDTLTRSRGSWLADGFRVGDLITSSGTVSNNFVATNGLTGVTATVLTFGTQDLTPEVVASITATVTAGETKAAWMAAVAAEFAPIDAAPRIDISAGRGRILSPFSGWELRRPAMWAASLREYQHDLQIATWRKSDGPTGFDLFDESEQLVEWDDRADGGAASANRFTSLRTYGNGPEGAYIALSLTRDTDGSILGLTHNMAVTNLACSVNQAVTENVIGRSLVLNPDGTATSAALGTIQSEVENELEAEMLADNEGEGQRASIAKWQPSTKDILNVEEAELTGTLTLELDGTIFKVATAVAVS